MWSCPPACLPVVELTRKRLARIIGSSGSQRRLQEEQRSNWKKLKYTKEKVDCGDTEQPTLNKVWELPRMDQRPASSRTKHRKIEEYVEVPSKQEPREPAGSGHTKELHKVSNSRQEPEPPSPFCGK